MTVLQEVTRQMANGQANGRAPAPQRQSLRWRLCGRGPRSGAGG
jgi:hypothetical protein